jgi:hypothetical protein
VATCIRVKECDGTAIEIVRHIHSARFCSARSRAASFWVVKDFRHTFEHDPRGSVVTLDESQGGCRVFGVQIARGTEQTISIGAKRIPRVPVRYDKCFV